MTQQTSEPHSKPAPRATSEPPQQAPKVSPFAKLKGKGLVAYEDAARWPLNHIVKPTAAFWFWPFFLIFLAWIWIPMKRATTKLEVGYRDPKRIKKLNAPYWHPLGWMAMGFLVWYVALMHPVLGNAWSPWAWLGFRVEMSQTILFGIIQTGTFTLASGLIFWMVRYSRDSMHAGEHGAAAWATFRDVIQARSARFRVPIKVHYRGTRRNWYWDESGAGVTMWAPPDAVAVAHYLILGSTRSGKTESIFNHMLASSTCPVIYQDVKAECPMLDHPRRRNAIRWGCAAKGGWPSMRWNPLEECRRIQDPAMAETAWNTLAAMLLPAKSNNDVSWVEDIGRPILAEGLRDGGYQSLAEFAEAVRDVPLDQLLVEMALPRGLTGLMKGKNVPEYVAMSFYSAMAIYRTGWAREATSGHDFCIEDMLKRGGYILSATGSVEAQSAPIKLFWQMLFTYLMTSKDGHRLTILMDEGLAAGKIPNLQDGLVTLGSKGVSVVMGIQTESGLLDVYSPTTGKAILDAFGNRIVVLHGLDPTDVESWSKRLGTWTKSRRQAASRGGSMTPQTVAMPLLTASEMAKRGSRLRDRWIILICRESSRSGLPIIGRALATDIPTRPPTAAELEALRVPDVEVRKREAKPEPAPRPKRAKVTATKTGDDEAPPVPEWPEDEDFGPPPPEHELYY